MDDLKLLAKNLLVCIEQDLRDYKEDYRDSPEDTQSIPALKIRQRELEEIWTNIESKYLNLRESPQMSDREASKGLT